MKSWKETFGAMIFYTLLAGILQAQTPTGITWKFQPGDDPAWAAPDFDDSGWKDIASGTVWERQGYPALDGYAWYRGRVVIPSALKAKAEKHKGFLLKLGRIDDADATYFNGVPAGKTGDFPPTYECQWDREREYSIPLSLICWDKPNVIAVRVYDAGGDGGMWGSSAVLTLRGLADLFKIEIGFKEADHVFFGAAKRTVPVLVMNGSDETLEGKLSLTVTTDFKTPVLDVSKPLKSSKHSEKRLDFELPVLEPGFYLAEALFTSPLHAARHRFAFAVDPEKVVSPPDSPEDFAHFWKRARKELDTVDPQYQVIRKDSLCTAKRDVYLVEMRSLGNVLIRGWYSIPKKPGQYPTFLHVQGYSSNMQPGSMVQDDDFVSFGLNIRGHGNSRFDVDPGFPGFLQDHLWDKECYIYRGAYMDCVRALDFLFSRPEVDTDRIVVEGSSQGGALSFVTAALNPGRIRLCVPSVPFLSDFPDYFKTASWPGNEFETYFSSHPGATWDDIFGVLKYFDIKNLAPWIKAPVFMSVGLLDETCPPHINFAAYNNLTVSSEYRVYPYAGHGLPSESYTARMAWIRKQLGMP